MKTELKNLPETNIQFEFFDFTIGNPGKTFGTQSEARVYRELVFFRFYETLKNSFPLLHNYVGDDLFRDCIARFIKKGSETLLIWKVPLEFRRFVVSSKMLKDLPVAKSFLTYNAAEIELLMGNYSKIQRGKFAWSSLLKLSKTSRLLKLGYPVHKRNFNEKEQTFLILYYDLTDHKVHYIESSAFMFFFFKELKKSSPEKALLKTCRDFHLDPEQSKNILEPVLNSYCSKKILVST